MWIVEFGITQPTGIEWHPVRARKKPGAKESRLELHATEDDALAHIAYLRETQPQMPYRVAVAPPDASA